MRVLWKYLSRSFLFWVAVGLCAFSLLLMGDSLGRVFKEAWLRLRGAPAEGIVTSADSRGTKTRVLGSRLRHHYLRFTFRDASGKEQAGEAKVRESMAPEFPPGSPVRVLYLPAEPSFCALPAVPANSLTEWLFDALGATMLIGGLLVARAALRTARRAARLLQRGTVIQARVVAVEEDLNSKISGRHPKFLRYAFTASEDGKTYEGQSPHLPLVDEARWPAGSTVPVVYDPLRPADHEADIFGLRTRRG